MGLVPIPFPNRLRIAASKSAAQLNNQTPRRAQTQPTTRPSIVTKRARAEASRSRFTLVE